MTRSNQLPINNPSPGYRPQAIDTNIEADLVRFHLYRQRTTVERLLLGAKFRQSARQLSIEYSISILQRRGCANEIGNERRLKRVLEI